MGFGSFETQFDVQLPLFVRVDMITIATVGGEIHHQKTPTLLKSLHAYAASVIGNAVADAVVHVSIQIQVIIVVKIGLKSLRKDALPIFDHVKVI